MQRRADGTRIELVDIRGELPSPSLSAHGSNVAAGIFGRLPRRLLEVNGHRITVTISGPVLHLEPHCSERARACSRFDLWGPESHSASGPRRASTGSSPRRSASM